MNQETYRKLISGQSKGAGASLARAMLRILSWCYAIVICVRNFLYCHKWLRIHRVNVPVISVGNITTGGTGKTPLVIWLYDQIIQNPKSKIQNCAILTRGYKTTQNSKQKTQNYIDEPKILADNCPHAKVIVNPDRVAGAQEAIDKYKVQVLIMDDGFQHRRLGRNLDIAAIDATCPFGYGKMLPAGFLREPVSALTRANAAVITRSDQINKEELAKLEAELSQINPDMLIARSIHRPLYARTTHEEQIGIEQLRGKRVFAFCGIGNPDAFLGTVRKTGVELVGSKVFNDHHAYTGEDIADIYEEARYLRARLIITTQKDWTKILSKKLPEAGILFAYLEMKMEFTGGEDKLKQLIETTLTGKIQKS